MQFYLNVYVKILSTASLLPGEFPDNLPREGNFDKIIIEGNFNENIL